MSSRTPWHKHEFSGSYGTPSSCLVCSGKADAPQHQLFSTPGEEKITPPPDPPQPPECDRCGSNVNVRVLPENGAKLCPGCVEILKP